MAYELHYTGAGYPSRTEIEKEAVKKGFTHSYWASEYGYAGSYNGDTVVVYNTTEGMNSGYKADAEKYGKPISENINISNTTYSVVTDEDVRCAISDIRRKHSKVVKSLKKYHSEFSELTRSICEYTYELNNLVSKYKFTASFADGHKDGDKLTDRIAHVSADLENLDKLSDVLYEAEKVFNSIDR